MPRSAPWVWAEAVYALSRRVGAGSYLYCRSCAFRISSSPVRVREALGKGSGGDYMDYYAEVKQREFMDYHTVVSRWEVERYLTLF